MQTIARATTVGLLAVACASGGCTRDSPPPPQLLVVLDTDVPVPEFADRVRIEVFDSLGDTPPSTREVVVSSAADLPISFGFRAADDASTGTARLRVRAYRSADTVFDSNGAEPQVVSTIDRIVNLRADPG